MFASMEAAMSTKDEVCDRVLQLIRDARPMEVKLRPISVNWHYTRECNYKCEFCFHTATTSFFLPKTADGMEEAKEALRKLKAAGMEKINFSGGEPFLHPKELAQLCRFCKETLQLPSVSIVSNGSKIQQQWLADFGKHVDILAISCDSFDEDTNKALGRGTGNHLTKLRKIQSWCQEYEVQFKINSVICARNVDENMVAAIEKLQPKRWKVFQCLLLQGENKGIDAKRDATNLAISSEQFDSFLHRHSSVKCLVPENNAAMRDSYLILDEEMRFLNCTGDSKKPSRSLRHVSVEEALLEAGFDEGMFRKRGGIYDWTKPRAEPKATDVQKRTSVPPLLVIPAFLALVACLMVVQRTQWRR